MSTLNVQNIEGITGFTVGDVTYPSSGQLSNRNLIINGAMQVAQRGTSSTSAGFATVDRFIASDDGTMASAVVTQSQASEGPNGFSTSYKLTVGTAETAAALDYYYVRHCIEAQNLQHLNFGLSSAENITLSFWVRSSVTGTYTVNLYRHDASRSFPKTYTIDAANTWEKKTIVIAGDTTGSIANDNGRGIDIYWLLSAGSSYNYTGTDNTWQSYANSLFGANHAVDLIGTSGATWQITGVQLEVGDTATPFEHRSYGDELARCQRYYYSASASNYGSMYGGSHSMINWYFPVTMRATPSVSYTQGGGGSVSSNYVSKDKAQAYCINDTSVYGNNFTADAEL